MPRIIDVSEMEIDTDFDTAELPIDTTASDTTDDANA
jgi:hypothetical protein